MYTCIICEQNTARDGTVITGVLRQCVCRRCDERITDTGHASAAQLLDKDQPRHNFAPHRELVGSGRW